MLRMAVLALVAVSLISCGGSKEDPGTGGSGSGGGSSTDITLGKPSPPSALEEDVVGHNKIFTIACSGQLSAKMETNTWATVKNVQKVGSTNTWNVTVELAFNSTAETREDKLIFSSGSKSVEATVRQKPLSSLLGSTTSITIDGMEPATITLNFPVDWKISLTDTKAVSDWLSISPDSGNANSAVTIVFSPKSVNLSAEDRKAFGKIDLVGGTLYLDIAQTSSLPGADFTADDASYGMYNVYTDGSGIVYDELAHQLNTFKSSSTRNFRIVDPVGNKYLEFAGLPESYTEGDAVSFTVNNYWDKSLDGVIEARAWVAKAAEGRVWLVDDRKRGYIIAE